MSTPTACQKRFNFYLPLQLKGRLDAQAKRRGITTSEILRALLEKAVTQLEAK